MATGQQTVDSEHERERLKSWLNIYLSISSGTFLDVA